MKEIWKDIKGYEGLYQVSNLGNIKSLGRLVTRGNNQVFKPESLLMPGVKNTGYCNVILCKEKTKKTFLIHRLVAVEFISNPENKKTVNHKDGNKLNNHIQNLEWNTLSENLKHAYRFLNRKPARSHLGKKGILSPFSKKVIGFKLNGKIIYQFDCTQEAKVYGLIPESVARCARGERKYYNNIVWKYI